MIKLRSVLPGGQKSYKNKFINRKRPHIMGNGGNIPGEVKIFMNHLYEFKKGVRNMVLYTVKREHEGFMTQRLENQDISYIIQEVGETKINLFFGKPECLEAIRHMILRPLNQLTPEEDFILGAMLGYDICQQCKRYCGKRRA